MTIVIFPKLTQAEASAAWPRLKKWFADNPDRIDCQMEVAVVRRSHMKEDFLLECEDGVVLDAPKIKKKKVAKIKK